MFHGVIFMRIEICTWFGVVIGRVARVMGVCGSVRAFPEIFIFIPKRRYRASVANVCHVEFHVRKQDKLAGQR